VSNDGVAVFRIFYGGVSSNIEQRVQATQRVEILSKNERISAMDYIWTPWRYAYITGGEKTSGCIFCDCAAKGGDDEKSHIVYRGTHCFIILNTYPYTSGHVMLVPFQHVDELRKLPPVAATEMMALCQRMEGVLRGLYKPEGINMGMNIGKAAGAGIAGHIHMHVLPRWVADANFMSVVGETRVLPEALDVTWKRIKEALKSSA
jgi:ATP adenylyltransferase